MRITIASLKGIQFEGEAAALNVKTTSGEITLLNHHRPLITVLEPGTATITMPDGGRRELPLGGGFLEMGTGNTLSVLMD